MQDIIELERRIAAAFDRIDRGLEMGARATVVQPVAAPESAQMATLIRALETARDASADWAARYAALEARMADETLIMAGQIAQLTDELAEQTDTLMALQLSDAQPDAGAQRGAEMQAMDDQMADLRQRLAAQSAELDALRSQRSTEVQEMDAIIAALNPLIEEAESHA
jgi:chromosome segregation ATPase